MLRNDLVVANSDEVLWKVIGLCKELLRKEALVIDDAFYKTMLCITKFYFI